MQRQSDRVVDGRTFYVVTFKAEMGDLFSSDTIFGDMGELGVLEVNGTGEILIDAETLLPHKVTMSCEDCFLPFMIFGSAWHVTLEADLSAFDEAVALPGPEDEPTLLPETTPTPTPAHPRPLEPARPAATATAPPAATATPARAPTATPAPAVTVTTGPTPTPTPTPAPTFTVNSTTDAADANPGDRLCDDGAGNCTLRAAIQETNAIPGLDVIALPTGTYTLNIPAVGESDANGDLDVTDHLTIFATDPTSPPVIDGGGLFRVMLIAEGASVHISDAVVQNGDAGGNGGGGISNSGRLTLDRVTVRNNTSGAPGGGIVNGPRGTLSVEDSLVTGNSAFASGGIRNLGIAFITNSTISNNTTGTAQPCDGGGIDNNGGGVLTIVGSTVIGNFAQHGGGISNDGGTMTITDTLVRDNRAGWDGGGILNISVSSMTITNSVISANRAHVAAGINNAGRMTIEDSTVDGNLAEGWAAGGIANGGTLTITNSTLSNNAAPTSGGGAIWNSDPDSSLTTTDVTFRGNTANHGAGILNSGTVLLWYTTLSGNVAQGSGAAMMNQRGTATFESSAVWGNETPGIGAGVDNIEGGSLFINNSTFSGNTADGAGGAIHTTGGTVTVTNSTLYGNRSNHSGGLQNNEGIVTLNNTIVAGSTGLSCAGQPFQTGTGNLTDDEMCTTDPGPEAGFTQVADVGLAPLADNGGSTYSHSLLPNSPAIDSGDDSVCPDIDQRGANRPRDGDRDGSPACDIGAFEW